MRPYQIRGHRKGILNKIDIARNARTLGTVHAGGYVWPFSGSGKTLSWLQNGAAGVAGRGRGQGAVRGADRKDLDYQTMLEYDRFEMGAANSNTSTAVLKRQLGDPSARIIVTTIQKLSTFIAGNRDHAVYDGHVVIIFDECHRSQFGDMHTVIGRAFSQYTLFGFTGTPSSQRTLLPAEMRSGEPPSKQLGGSSHTRTRLHGRDHRQNVLPFRIDYVNTIQAATPVTDKQVFGIRRGARVLAPRRVSQVVAYTREHFEQKTKTEQKLQSIACSPTSPRSLALAAKIPRKKRESRDHGSMASTPSLPQPPSTPPSASTRSS
ncbi:MAG: DEAD/DEAH box helicase family protein, partial [Sandaracinaceae bacterium]|nr:DEAD/DEAH box helicase family protein [Sandaracinaceae bacterium]